MSQTPAENNAQATVELLKSYGVGLLKEVFRDLVDGTERAWEVQFKSFKGTVKTVRGTQRTREPVATFKEYHSFSRSTALGVLSKLDYGDLGPTLGTTLTTVGKTYDFMSSWYGTFKVAASIATRSLGGPVGLTLAIVDVAEALIGAHKDLAEWYDSLGLEEHKREGAHLQRLKAYHDLIGTNVVKCIDSSWSLPSAKSLQAATSQLAETINRFTLTKQNERVVYSLREMVVNRHRTNMQRHLADYAEHLQALVGLGLQAGMLHCTLGRVIADVDANPLRYWGCSFQFGYKNPGPGMIAEVFDPKTVSLVLLRPHVKNYVVSAQHGTAEMRAYVNHVLGSIKENVRDAAAGFSKQLAMTTMPLVQQRTNQLIHEMAIMQRLVR